MEVRDLKATKDPQGGFLKIDYKEQDILGRKARQRTVVNSHAAVREFEVERRCESRGSTAQEDPMKPAALILLSIRGHKIDRYEQVMAIDAVAHNIGGNAFTEPSE